MTGIKSTKGIFTKVGIVAIAVVLSFVALTSHQHKRAYGAQNGNIVYVGDDGSNNQIFTINVDGSSKQQLTTDNFSHFSPAYSPTGTKIAYVGDPNNDGSYQIYTMRFNGDHQVNLTNDNNTMSNEPAWSPNGTKIAFTRNDGVVANAIYIMNADGSNPTAITNADGQRSPAWSPDGTKLAYTLNDQIYTSNSDGTNQQQIVNDSNSYASPAWSPDGTTIAYAVGFNPYDRHLGMMNANGSGKHDLLTSANFDNEHVSWSPDGTKLLYEGTAGVNSQIFTANLDGSGETAVTLDTEFSSYPHWQPIRDSDGDGQINTLEALGPNNGDANADGIADELQPQVTPVVNPLTGKYNILQSNCTANGSLSVGDVPSGFKDKAFSYPEGLLNFTLTCASPGATATVTVYYYGLQNSSNLVVRKYNATTHAYQTVPGATISAATVDGQALTKVSYQVTDGGSLDQDGTPNGVIVDPVGVAIPAAGAPNTGLGGTAGQ